ncbi:MAG: cytochrome c [Nitrospinae bacterium]|nr:cytochrome c [Nitrospinota bacterium]
MAAGFLCATAVCWFSGPVFAEPAKSPASAQDGPRSSPPGHENGPVAAHKGEPSLNEGGPEISGLCPQPRRTPQAPDPYYTMKNPLEPSERNILAGKTLFHFDTRPTPCRICHGLTGNGLGLMFKQTTPQPRNFTCYVTMKKIPDGQMFWIIQNGSPGTDMPAYKNLEDDQIWQLVLYIRHIEE